MRNGCALEPAAPAGSEAGGSPPGLRWLEPVLSGALLLLILGLLAVSLLYGTVWVRGYYDDNAYHIPNAIRMAQQLNPLVSPDSPVDSHWFPAGASIPVALLLRAAGTINVTNLTGPIAFALLAFLVYRFTGLWTRMTHVRLACVALTCCIPLLLGQCLAFYVDIHMALLIVWTVYWVAVALVRGHSQYAYGAFAVLLLTPGIKYSGLLYAALLTPFCVWAVWRAGPPRRPRWYVCLAILFSVAFSSGWYVRNWWYRGNPVYPFCVPGWAQALVKIGGAPYECDPQHGFVSPATQWPHPFLPEHWLAYKYYPDMTGDGFGAAFVAAVALALLAVPVVLPRLAKREREAWLLVWAAGLVFALASPLARAVPRYMLFVPILATVQVGIWGAQSLARPGRWAACALSTLALGLGVLYCWTNVVAAPSARNSLGAALPYLRPYRPQGIHRYDDVELGGQRIGYLSGADNFVALLYDAHLTNKVVPLHFRNYPYHWWREFDTPEQFIEHVRALGLYAIYIFDPKTPGADLLKTSFPSLIRQP